jgi:hypothetical protein
MKTVGITLIFGAIGCIMLHAFYAAVKLEWPSNYVTATRRFGLIVNRTVKRYLTFIIAPVYLASLLVSSLSSDAKGHGVATGLIVGTWHAWKNHGKQIFAHVRHGTMRNAAPDLILQIALLVLAVLAGFAGGLGPGPFTFVIPSLDEFFTAVWTAVFVAIVSFWAFRATRYKTALRDLYDTARREADDALVDYAIEVAQREGADLHLVLSVLFAENLQRPPWFRKLENWKGKIFPRGSYGIMQFTSPHPISDRESIDRAVELLKDKTIGRNENGVPDRESLRNALKAYNDNPGFVELAEGLYPMLVPDYRP